MNSHEFRRGDWVCVACFFNNFKSRSACFKCATQRPTEPLPPDVQQKVDEVELQMLRRQAAAAAAAPENTPEHAGAKRPRTEGEMTEGAVSAAAAAAQSTEGLPPKPVRKPKFVFAVDLESVGAPLLIKPGRVLMIGGCFGRSDGTILEQRHFCWSVPPQAEFEKHCVDTFWHKYPQVLERIAANASEAPFTEFLEWVEHLRATYGPFERGDDGCTLEISSDNAGFDIGELNRLKADYKRGERLLHIASALKELADDAEGTDAVGRAADLRAQSAAICELVPRELLSSYTARVVIARFDDAPLEEAFGLYVPTVNPNERERGLTDGQKRRVAEFITAPHSHWAVDDATQIFQRHCGVAAVLGK